MPDSAPKSGVSPRVLSFRLPTSKRYRRVMTLRLFQRHAGPIRGRPPERTSHCKGYIFVLSSSILNDETDFKFGRIVPSIVKRYPLADEDFDEIVIDQYLHVDQFTVVEFEEVLGNTRSIRTGQGRRRHRSNRSFPEGIHRHGKVEQRDSL